jgi:hypothetical protein
MTFCILIRISTATPVFGKNLFTSPTTRSFLFNNMKSNFIFFFFKKTNNKLLYFLQEHNKSQGCKDL